MSGCMYLSDWNPFKNNLEPVRSYVFIHNGEFAGECESGDPYHMNTGQLTGDKVREYSAPYAP
jgi:hypothetical protein